MGKSTVTSNKINHFGLLTIMVLALAIIPVSLWAISQPVSYIPKAASPSGSTTPASHSPRLTSPLLTRTIHCTVGQACEQVFEVTDQDADDSLTLAIDFLPPALKQNTCQQSSLPSRTTLNCSFSGIPERSGEFTILLTAADTVRNQETKTLTLKITE